MNAIGSREHANGCRAAKALKPERSRELVRGMCADWAVSIRRACGTLRFDGSSYHDKSRRTDPAELKRRIKEICQTRVRSGSRRVYVVLDREGWEVSIKTVYNVYRALGLQLRNKTPEAAGEGQAA